MAFWIGLSIIGLACTAISYKILVGYENYSPAVKLTALCLLLLAWFGPTLVYAVRSHEWVGETAGAVLTKISYFLMGTALILIVTLLIREIIWSLVYLISRKPEWSPNNIALLHRNNMRTLVFVFCVAVYGVYEAHKIPAVLPMTIEDARVLKETRLVVASDLHIDASMPLSRVKMFVDRINEQKPDYVLLVGDIVDDDVNAIADAVEELKNIKAKRTFISLGNHEYYNSAAGWMIAFTKAGLTVLHNTGEVLDDTGIYVGGVPDPSITNINFKKAFYTAKEDEYKVLMSHTPQPVDTLEQGQTDLMVSGHTHGGQIFPLMLFAKMFNGYLAGEYEVNGTKLLVSRGAGYWGPPMRLLAPSDMFVIDFRGKEDEK